MSQPLCSDKEFTNNTPAAEQPFNTHKAQPTELVQNQHSEELGSGPEGDEHPFYHQQLLFSSYYNSMSAMELETLFIGSNTRNGRPIKDHGHAKHYNNGNKTPGKIEVYANGVYLKQMPFKVLVRFSKAASAVFPKNANISKAGDGSVKGKKADGQTEKEEPKKWADDDGKTPPRLPQEAAKPNEDTSPTSISASRPANGQINFYHEKMWIQPPKEAFEYAFNWMSIAKETPPTEKPLDYGAQDPDMFNLEQLVDLYAVALVLDIRPPVHKHRFNLLTKLTETKPTLATLTYVHERLPLSDVAVTRLITSYFEHYDRYDYSEAEYNEIWGYVSYVDLELHTRFEEIEEARRQKSRAMKKRREESKLERATEQYLYGCAETGAVQGGRGRRGGRKKHDSVDDSGYVSTK